MTRTEEIAQSIHPELTSIPEVRELVEWAELQEKVISDLHAERARLEHENSWRKMTTGGVRLTMRQALEKVNDALTLLDEPAPDMLPEDARYAAKARQVEELAAVVQRYLGTEQRSAFLTDVHDAERHNLTKLQVMRAWESACDDAKNGGTYPETIRGRQVVPAIPL